MLNRLLIATVATFIVTSIVHANTNSIQNIIDVDIEKHAMNSLGYDISKNRNAKSSNKFAMPEPYSSRQLVTYEYVGIMDRSKGMRNYAVVDLH